MKVLEIVFMILLFPLALILGLLLGVYDFYKSFHKSFIKTINKENQEMSKELSPLEDIEEELGIDLITLFKALKNGVYCEHDKKHHIVALDLGSSGNYRLSYQIIDDLFESVYVKDYGKTWALTKEELL